MTAVMGEPSARRVSPWNPANAVTASRYLTLALLWWAVARGEHQYAALFIIICGLLDKLDGFAARIFDCSSAFGEMFDAITDAICYGASLVIVTAYGWAPAGPVAIVVGLGALNAALRLVYARRAGRTVNYKSYAMERMVAYLGYMIAAAAAGVEVRFFYWVVVPVMALIVLHDAKRMLVDPIPGAVHGALPGPIHGGMPQPATSGVGVVAEGVGP